MDMVSPIEGGSGWRMNRLTCFDGGLVGEDAEELLAHGIRGVP
jgi:hypothetical protein